MWLLRLVRELENSVCKKEGLLCSVALAWSIMDSWNRDGERTAQQSIRIIWDVLGSGSKRASGYS